MALNLISGGGDLTMEFSWIMGSSNDFFSNTTASETIDNRIIY